MRSVEELWRSLCRLLERVDTAQDREGFLEACLDTLVEQYRAQRGLILQASPSGVATVLAARGPRRDLTPGERQEISRTIIREAEKRGEAVLWESEELGTSASIEALTITAALVAPLRAFRGQRGVLYVDFRDVMRSFDERDLELFRAAAALVSVVLAQSEQLQVARESLRAARAEVPISADSPTLDELLWPRSMAAIRREVQSALHGRSSILILGESGTGKTALAAALAAAAGQAPVVRATLGQSDDLNTITSELFGHERGAFSGAIARRVGLVELAKGGVLILDEILNLPRLAQQLLLDFTQFGTYRPLGYEGVSPKQVNVRILAATNGDLDAAVREGRFRQDLYYRLAGRVLRLPPLRARRDEIPDLAEAFLARIEPNREVVLALPVRRVLTSPLLDWPGNVRELEALVRRALERAVADGGAEIREIGLAHLDADLVARAEAEPGPATPQAAASVAEPDEAPWAPSGGASLLFQDARKQALEGFERSYLASLLRKHGGNVAEAALATGLSRVYLYRLLGKYELLR